MRDLMITQCSTILLAPEHIKQFQALSREHNFIFRAEMAESLGNIKKKSFDQEWGMTKEEFQEHYFDELLDLVNDSDNMVRIKALKTVGNIIDYIEESYLTKEIIPSFLRLTESILEDEDGM
jgi:DNA-binding GntR family transcriptional regulator